MGDRTVRALVTGATGFLGRHLVTELQQVGETVVPASRSFENGDNGQWLRFDMCDRPAVRLALEQDIDVVFHLAFSRSRPSDMAQTSLEGTATLLEEAASMPRPPRIVLVSSGAVYGWASGRRALEEQDALTPATYYAVLKLAQEHLAQSYSYRKVLHVVTVRPFNLVGPGEDGTLVTGGIAYQIARGERAGGRFEVRTRGLGTYRDFVDIRDAARAVVLAARIGAPGEVFNVCSGRAVQVKTILDLFGSASQVPFTTVLTDADDCGPNIPYQVGSARRLQERTGWTPEIALEQSLADLLDETRRKVAADVA